CRDVWSTDSFLSAAEPSVGSHTTAPPPGAEQSVSSIPSRKCVTSGLLAPGIVMAVRGVSRPEEGMAVPGSEGAGRAAACSRVFSYRRCSLARHAGFEPAVCLPDRDTADHRHRCRGCCDCRGGLPHVAGPL